MRRKDALVSEIARKVFEIEAAAILDLAGRLDQSFDRAVEILFACSGRVVLTISNSGETEEILALAPAVKRLSLPLVAMTGDPKSTLAGMADVHLDVSIPEEAGPLGLAPTASTTAALAMGDALAW